MFFVAFCQILKPVYKKAPILADWGFEWTGQGPVTVPARRKLRQGVGRSF